MQNAVHSGGLFLARKHRRTNKPREVGAFRHQLLQGGEVLRHRIEGLLLAPVDPAALYAGKLAANLVYLAAMEVVLLPAFIVFLDVPPGRLFPEIVPVLVAADVGLAAVGTLLGAASQYVRARELVLPLLAFPAMLPVVLGAIRLTSTLFASGGFGGQASWFALLGATDIAYLAIGTVTFEYVLTE